MTPAGAGIPAKRARRRGNGAYANAAGNAGRRTRIITSRWADTAIFAKEESENMKTSFRGLPKTGTRNPGVFLAIFNLEIPGSSRRDAPE
jgi:hypothetical protein